MSVHLTRISPPDDSVYCADQPALFIVTDPLDPLSNSNIEVVGSVVALGN